MLGVGGFAPPSAPPLLWRRTTTINPSFSNISSNALTLPSTYFPHLKGRIGYRLFAQKKQLGASIGSIELKEANIDEIDKDDLVFDEFDDDWEDEDEDENEDEDVIFPFHEMRAWFKNRPKGFGEGKVYDTSVEDKLMEEIEQSRKAQLANVNKLKNASKVPTSKSECKNDPKASEGVSYGIRVRISGLPKKKNILRDLKSAFKGVGGIINISPMANGNKKTRDPVCKGFGFVDFKSLEDANRFVQMFSGKGIPFGKIEKRITCEIMKLNDTDIEDSAQDGYTKTSESRFIVSDDDEADENFDAEQSEFWEDIDIDDEFDDEEFDDDIDDEFDGEDIVNTFEPPKLSEDVESSIEKLEKKLMSHSAPAMGKEKTKNVKKKSAPRKKSNKTTPKLKIPGSAERLKVREKAKLEDVLSRYGSKEVMASEQK